MGILIQVTIIHILEIQTHYGNTNPSFTHYHYNHYHPVNNPSPPINNYVIPGNPGFSHQHYHLHPGNNY